MLIGNIGFSPQNLLRQRLINPFRRAKINFGNWLIQKMAISKRELEPVPTIFTKIGDILTKPFVKKDLPTQILMGPLSFQVFKTSYDLGIFNHLNKHPGATSEQITQQLNIKQYPLEILLLGLMGLKLIKKVGNNYYNSAAIRIITQDNDNKFTQFFPKYMQYAQHILIKGLHHLQESVVENKPVGLSQLFGDNATDYYYELSKNPSANRYFSEHMSSFSQINAKRLAKLSNFKYMKTLLDVGGGVGDVAISIASENNNIHVTVYDHPNVAQMATENIQQKNLAHKIKAVGADITTSSLPDNYDGVLFSHFIDIFSPEENLNFFKKAHTALNDKGSLIVYTPVVHDDHSGPLVNCLLGAYFLSIANGKGRFYSALQISNWMKESGYVNIKIKRLPSYEAIIIGSKP